MRPTPAASPLRARIALEPLEARLAPATFSVTTSLDENLPGNGQVSLREAINKANATPGADVIAFAMNSGLITINIVAPLPTVTDRVTIAGQTQPGFAGRPLIELNGTNTTSANGLEIDLGASGTVVRGLVINRFDESGIAILANNCVVKGCYIGTNSTGTASLGNGSFGIAIGAGHGNVLGGNSPAARNVISGNGQGVRIAGGNTSGNRVIGNFIGTDRTGKADLGNGNGVIIVGGASDNAIGGVSAAERNVISGNTIGVLINGSGVTGNRVLGNYIGTDKTGTLDLGNNLHGVLIEESATGNVIGGATAAARNVISGNNSNGVMIDNLATVGNKIRGNYIGTDKTGTAHLGNDSNGVFIRDASENVIGGATTAAGNVVSGNHSSGVAISGLATGNRVLGNRIGLASPSALPLGNVGDGVRVSAIGNVIGGTQAGAGNVIAHNGLAGVVIVTGSANPVLRNRIFGNGGLGIDLNEDGVTPNDLGDPDTGPNGLQNFPTVNTAQVTAAGLRLTGAINTQTGKTLRIEFFASPSVDASGNGEGKRYLGFITLQTPAGPTATYSVTLAMAGVLPGQFITATATDQAGNTSEFSLARIVT
jgi:hypothetical protein